jgi:hypothetical protein
MWNLFKCIGAYNILNSNQIQIFNCSRFANRSARFMDAYRRGLNATQAAWANKKYHGHRVLPDRIIEDLEKAQSSNSI